MKKIGIHKKSFNGAGLKNIILLITGCALIYVMTSLTSLFESDDDHVINISYSFKRGELRNTMCGTYPCDCRIYIEPADAGYHDLLYLLKQTSDIPIGINTHWPRTHIYIRRNQSFWNLAHNGVMFHESVDIKNLYTPQFNAHLNGYYIKQENSNDPIHSYSYGFFTKEIIAKIAKIIEPHATGISNICQKGQIIYPYDDRDTEKYDE